MAATLQDRLHSKPFKSGWRSEKTCAEKHVLSEINL